MEENQESKSSWGGYRPGSGNKYKWKHGETKAVRIPIAITDEVIEVAKAIDAGSRLVPHDSVTQSSIAKGGDELTQCQTEVDRLKTLNSKLSSNIGELEADLIKAQQQLKQTTEERDSLLDRISDIELELANLKDDHVTQSRIEDNVTQSSIDAAALLNCLKDYLVTDKKGKTKLSLSRLETILEELTDDGR